MIGSVNATGLILIFIKVTSEMTHVASVSLTVLFIKELSILVSSVLEVFWV